MCAKNVTPSTHPLLRRELMGIATPALRERTVTPCLRNPPVILLEWLCELVASLLRKKRPRAPALTIKTVRLASLTDCAAAVDFRIAIQ